MKIVLTCFLISFVISERINGHKNGNDILVGVMGMTYFDKNRTMSDINC